MRRRVWVVLGLVGLAPVGALAEQSPEQAGRAPAVSAPADESQDDTDRAIIVEMPAQGQRRAGATASPGAGKAQVRRPSRSAGPGTGGSGMSQAPAAQRSAANTEVFQGTLRALEGDRLRMADANGYVYEFGLGQQTRIIGPEGEPVSPQSLREDMPVRAVTQPGASENEVVTLQAFHPVSASEQ